MLIEFLSSLTSSAVSGARRAGLPQEVAAIAARYRRQKTAWKPHLEACHRTVCEALDATDSKGPVLILGAGLCLDIPLQCLRATGREAHLVDAVLPFSTRLKLLRRPTLQFKCADITGFLAPFWHAKGGASIPMPATAPISTEGYSLVISANILSQLALPFAHSPPQDDTERRITATLQKAHVDALKAARCPVLLLTDYTRTITDIGTKSGADTEADVIPTVAPQLLPGEPDHKWDWHLAPLGELSKTSSTTLQVGSWLMKK